MKPSALVWKERRDAANWSLSSLISRRRPSVKDGRLIFRLLSTAEAKQPPKEVELELENGTSKLLETGQTRDKFGARDFILSVLGSSATKREAKSYLQRFSPFEKVPSGTEMAHVLEKTTQPKHGVNLGAFYGTTRAVEESPRFMQRPTDTTIAQDISGPLHVALVKIRAPQHISDEALGGIGRTLSQLGKLGLTSTVVVDCDDPSDEIRPEDWRSLTTQQIDRVVAAIDAYGEPGARCLDNIIGVSEKSTNVASAACVRGRTHVMYRKLLITPLRKGIIPVIAPVGYTVETLQAIPVKADDVVLALTREFAGLHVEPPPDENLMVITRRLKTLRNEASLDRIIVLDPLGGIPAADRPNGYHVFLNLEQEFGLVKQSLLPSPNAFTSKSFFDSSALQKVSDITGGNSFSKFAESEFSPLRPSTVSPTDHCLPRATDNIFSANLIHLQNLELVRRALSLLPPSSSGLITTPEEAANSGKTTDVPFQASGVGTRRQRNPLIHNLLTDKPAYSSSLPPGRLMPSDRTNNSSAVSAHIPPTTFVKRGMPVTIFPDPRTHSWEPCIPGKSPLRLTDAPIDLPRLVHLIEDSFNRKLDIKDYLKRVNDRIAGVIIAGEYEGGALLTWETPPGVPDDGSEESLARMVPYLDKFAVLRRSQGAGGVADIVFKAMVKDCFPDGVCWRSRRNNPVNKWYFERSRGTWKLPGTNWTMFWTSPSADIDQQRFSDYVDVCGSISPSWADNKAIPD